MALLFYLWSQLRGHRLPQYSSSSSISLAPRDIPLQEPKAVWLKQIIKKNNLLYVHKPNATKHWKKNPSETTFLNFLKIKRKILGNTKKYLICKFSIVRLSIFPNHIYIIIHSWLMIPPSLSLPKNQTNRVVFFWEFKVILIQLNALLRYFNCMHIYYKIGRCY